MNDIEEAILALQFHKFIDEETGAYSIHVGKAIEALEKQIPKQTEITAEDEHICPVCGCSNGSRFNHCWNCGQALARAID